MKRLAGPLVSLPVLLIARQIGYLFPFSELGFFCNDDEIRYPLRGDTVPSDVLDLTIAGVTMFSIIVSEISYIRRLAKKGKRVVRVRVGRWNIHPIVPCSLLFYLEAFCVMMANSVATTVGKRTASRLRPNFFEVCRPNVTESCRLGSAAYIAVYDCLGVPTDDSHLSFPSGHSSASACAMIFVVCYLQARFRFHAALRTAMQFAVFVGAYFVCLSRVRDFKHRYTDVLGGAALGTIIALSFVFLAFNRFADIFYHTVEDEIPIVVVPIERKDIARKTSWASRSDYGSLAGGGSGLDSSASTVSK